MFASASSFISRRCSRISYVGRRSLQNSSTSEAVTSASTTNVLKETRDIAKELAKEKLKHVRGHVLKSCGTSIPHVLSDTPEKVSSGIGALAKIVILGGVVAGLSLTGYSIYRGQQILSWPVLEGTVVSFDVRGELHHADITVFYKYTINGPNGQSKSFVGTEQLSGATVFQGTAMTQFVAYSLGGPCVVHVSREDPSVSVSNPFVIWDFIYFAPLRPFRQGKEIATTLTSKSKSKNVIV